MTQTASKIVYFDTLAYMNELKQGGVPANQAEVFAQAQAKVFDTLLETKLATKEDLLATKEELRGEIRTVREELRGEMGTLREELRTESTDLRYQLRSLEAKLTIKLGSIMIAGIGVLALLNKF